MKASNSFKFQPSVQVMLADAADWQQRQASLPDIASRLLLERSYMEDLCSTIGCPFDNDALPALTQSFADRFTDLLTYRDGCVPSTVTGKMAAKPKVEFMRQFDDSLKAFLQ